MLTIKAPQGEIRGIHNASKTKDMTQVPWKIQISMQAPKSALSSLMVGQTPSFWRNNDDIDLLSPSIKVMELNTKINNCSMTVAGIEVKNAIFQKIKVKPLGGGLVDIEGDLFSSDVSDSEKLKGIVKAPVFIEFIGGDLIDLSADDSEEEEESEEEADEAQQGLKLAGS